MFNSFQKHRKNHLQNAKPQKALVLESLLLTFHLPGRQGKSTSHALLMPRDRKFSQTFPGCPNHHSTCNFTEIIPWESISFHIISMYNKLSYFCYELNQIMIRYSLCLKHVIHKCAHIGRYYALKQLKWYLPVLNSRFILI